MRSRHELSLLVSSMENNKRVHLFPNTPDMDTDSDSSSPNYLEISVPPPTTPYQSLPCSKKDEDWEYRMRREMQEIVPSVFLGPYASASKSQLEILKSSEITHIVCIRHVTECGVIRDVHKEHFNYLMIDMGDDESVSLIPICNQVINFIKAVVYAGGKVLVHGNAGINRSASVMVAFIMANYGISLKKALAHVQARRFTANPSQWFMFQLMEFEAVYQAMHDISSTSSGGRKRNFSQISGRRANNSSDEEEQNSSMDQGDVEMM